jgi:hypothetical protein
MPPLRDDEVGEEREERLRSERRPNSRTLRLLWKRDRIIAFYKVFSNWLPRDGLSHRPPIVKSRSHQVTVTSSNKACILLGLDLNLVSFRARLLITDPPSCRCHSCMIDL